jgi:salicylate hydroxylase
VQSIENNITYIGKASIASKAFELSSISTLGAKRSNPSQFIKPTRWAIFDHPHTPTYYKSLICLLGDVAHASGPHQGAGAGQGLEDALILTHALSTLYHDTASQITLSSRSPNRTRAIEAAFQAYDEIRRPRAQKQVSTARECGEVYNLRDPNTGKDLSVEEALEDLNSRFEWLWKHNLENDVRRVEGRTEELLRQLQQ